MTHGSSSLPLPTSRLADDLDHVAQCDRPAVGMAWAVDSKTKRPVYVASLGREQTGLRCRCVCPACDATLQAVGVDRDGRTTDRSPFFRHHKAQQGPGCKFRVAELAALKLLAERGLIEVPAPRKRATYVGQSGEQYHAEHVGEAVHERILEHRLLGAAEAVLTLESGRQVALVLRGHQDFGELGSVFAVIEVQVDDPEVALMSPEDILARSELNGRWLHLVAHQANRQLEQAAQDDVRRQALEMLDIDPIELNLPVGATRKQASESIIHWVIKEALLQLHQLEAPAFSGVAAATGADGHAQTVEFGWPSATLTIRDVVEEVLLDGYRPDIMCTAIAHDATLGEFRLLVEVAVTSHVQVAKLARIRRDGLACIELDVVRFAEGGRAVTRTELRRLVAHDVQCKAWLHHPRLEELRALAQLKADAARDEADARHKAAQDRRRADEERQARQEREEQERAEREQREAQNRRTWASTLSGDQALRELRLVLERRWADELELTSNGTYWPPGEFDQAIAAVLPRKALSRHFADRGGIAWRFSEIIRARDPESLPADAAALTGPSAGLSGWMLDTWLGTIHLALEHFGVRIDPVQSESHTAGRERVLGDLHTGNRTYARTRDLDDILVTMFPELAAVLGQELGTEAFCERTERERAEAVARARRAKEESDARAAEEARQTRLRDELRDEVRLLGYRWKWKPNLTVPPTPEAACGYLRGMRRKDLPPWVIEFVRRGWAARHEGTPLAEWVALQSFSSLDEIALAREALEAAFLTQVNL